MNTQMETLAGRESSSNSTTTALATSSSIDNGSFETGDFQDWSTIGDTSIETDNLGIFPTNGTYQALISNGDSDAGGSVVDSDLEEFLDLAPGSLDGLAGSDAYEGSAIKRTLTVEAGDIVSFDWNFLTNEDTPSDIFNDTAFLNVDGFTFELADTGSTFVDAAKVDEFNEQTGTQTLTFAIAKAGTYTIGFGVVDVGDVTVDSGLAIDNLAVASSSSIGTANSTGSGSSPDLILGEDGFTSANGTSTTSEPSLTFGDNGFETV